MLLMSGLIGQIFQEFAVTLIAVTVISGIISLALTPMLCSRFLPNLNGENQNESKYKIFEWSKNLNLRMRHRYEKMLRKVIDHVYTALAIGALCLLLTIALFIYLPIDFVPDEDTGFFIAYTQGMEGGSSYRMLEYEKQVIDT